MIGVVFCHAEVVGIGDRGSKFGRYRPHDGVGLKLWGGGDRSRVRVRCTG